MLALLKLQLQRIGRKHEGEPVQRIFAESTEHVAATLEELRRIARDEGGKIDWSRTWKLAKMAFKTVLNT